MTDFDYNNLIREGDFRRMFGERLDSFLKSDTYSERDLDIIYAVVDIVSGVLTDISKLKE